MSTLQVIWFVLIGVLLTGYAILDGFDLGAGAWYLFSKKDAERRTVLSAIGPVWDGNEVWLLTGGGAIFAAFPPVYASAFSGFYLVLMLVVLGLVFRATAIEFRNQVESSGWRKLWDVAFSVGSILPAVLFGVALGNLVRGLELDESGNYVGGFFALLNPYALLVGLTGLAMFACHGALYLAVKTEGPLQQQARGWAKKAWAAYLILFLASAGWSLTAFQRGSVVLPAVGAAIALVALVAIPTLSRAGADAKAFLASAVSIAALLGATGATLYPDLVPASNDAARSLTVFNASSSQNTLSIMLVLALVGMPVVIGYTIYVYRVFKGKVGTGNGY